MNILNCNLDFLDLAARVVFPALLSSPSPARLRYRHESRESHSCSHIEIWHRTKNSPDHEEYSTRRFKSSSHQGLTRSWIIYLSKILGRFFPGKACLVNRFLARMAKDNWQLSDFSCHPRNQISWILFCWEEMCWHELLALQTRSQDLRKYQQMMWGVYLWPFR